MEHLHVVAVEVRPEEGNLGIEFDGVIFDDDEFPTLYPRHARNSVAAPDSMPERIWALCCDLLNHMGALYIVVEEQHLIIGLTTPADRNSTGVIEAGDFLLGVLATFAGTMPETPSLLNHNLALINLARPDRSGWNAARREVLDLLCDRTKAALNTALDSYKII